MLNETIANLYSLITSSIETYSYIAVFIFMFLESALVPIPSEVTMPFAGVLVGRGYINFWTVVIVGACANLAGSVAAYYLGYKKGDKWVVSAISKWGKYLLIKNKEYNRAKEWLTKYGSHVSFFSRIIPVVRTYVSLPAGISRINIFVFSFYTFIGSIIWSLLLTYLGFKLGQNWMVIEKYFRSYQVIIIVIGVLGLGVYVFRKLKKKI